MKDISYLSLFETLLTINFDEYFLSSLITCVVNPQPCKSKHKITEALGEIQSHITFVLIKHTSHSKQLSYKEL